MSLEHCAGGEPLAADVAVVHARRRVDSPVSFQSCGDSVGYFRLSTGGCFSTSETAQHRGIIGASHSAAPGSNLRVCGIKN